jgi:hypothetical protein
MNHWNEEWTKVHFTHVWLCIIHTFGVSKAFHPKEDNTRLEVKTEVLIRLLFDLRKSENRFWYIYIYPPFQFFKIILKETPRNPWFVARFFYPFLYCSYMGWQPQVLWAFGRTKTRRFLNSDPSPKKSEPAVLWLKKKL